MCLSDSGSVCLVLLLVSEKKGTFRGGGIFLSPSLSVLISFSLSLSLFPSFLLCDSASVAGNLGWWEAGM